MSPSRSPAQHDSCCRFVARLAILGQEAKANAAWHEWGTWPYQQRITDTTYWCAIYNKHITYRTSTTTASGLLCGVQWRAGALIAGGVGRGFTYFTNRASAGFSCQTIIPWITLHTTHHLDVKRTDTGVTTQVGTG